MKIAIHNTPGTFSDRWIDYCKEKGISYKIVNCYDNNIMQELSNCNALMWHFKNYDYRDMLIARSVLYSASKLGLSVFPNFNTIWHFDDKIAQKYLLEAVNAPLVSSYVFFDKVVAKNWIKTASFPKVFKLRGGSGSSNVYLVKNKSNARKLVDRAFKKGFSPYNKWRVLKENIRKYKSGLVKFRSVLISFYFLFFDHEYSKYHGKEIGYAYFQDFIPENSYDVRVVISGNKAFAIKRMNRVGDFRASGSGHIIYDPSQIDIRLIELSFNMNNKLNSQSVAFDFLKDENNNPKLVEISYGYVAKGYDACPGYWDKDLSWHEGKFNPYGWMIDNLIQETEH